MSKRVRGGRRRPIDERVESIGTVNVRTVEPTERGPVSSVSADAAERDITRRYDVTAAKVKGGMPLPTRMLSTPVVSTFPAHRTGSLPYRHSQMAPAPEPEDRLKIVDGRVVFVTNPARVPKSKRARIDEWASDTCPTCAEHYRDCYCG